MNSLTIGSQFDETVDGTNVTRTCTTEGTGSITIGSGANTLNTTKTVDGVETTVESSNSITIGCKAENKGADSVVIGAGASGEKAGSIAMGARASAQGTGGCAIGLETETGDLYSVALGKGAKAKHVGAVSVGHSAETYSHSAVAIGNDAQSTGTQGIAIGRNSKVSAHYAVALGGSATVSDQGATVIRSTAGVGTYTQLYFSGQNTPLALKYYPTEWEKKQDVDDQGNPKVDDDGNPIMIDDKDKPTKGQAMMGYVVSKEITNEEGKKEIKVLECGTNLLAALFPNHGLGDNPFQPTTTAIDGEEIMSFHPSDLDMPIEEDTLEPEEYQPLPVYPIVEPEIEEYIQE